MPDAQWSRRRLSRFLSLVLRHRPERIGVRLDARGWAEVDELVVRSRAAGVPLTRARLLAVVDRDDKQRFSLTPDSRRVRANQGHSLPVDLELLPREPPEELFHGTARRSLPDIRRDGLTGRGRNHVHLSGDPGTATTVGRRHGDPVVLTVAAGAMHRQGHELFQSENGVWLTATVPPRFLARAQDSM